MRKTAESLACTPQMLDGAGFNPDAQLPHGLEVLHVRNAMQEFLDFLGFVNTQLHTKNIQRLESMLMAANFSSVVGEFIASSLPKYCHTIARNRFHNGHPDLIPKGRHPKDSVQYHHEGIEVKASRYEKGWQGHNPEDVFLLVFVFDSNGPADDVKGVPPRPFRFKMVVGADVAKSDWNFSGRSTASRRTITASITQSGYDKMIKNWIYLAPDARAKIIMNSPRRPLLKKPAL